MYSQRAPFPVYQNEYWWGDTWDPRQYGQSYDPHRPFLEQYAELSKRVPRFAIMNFQCEGCEYSNFALQARDCYLVFGCVRSERCLYGHIIWDSESCIDNVYAYRSQWCSNNIDIVGCYNLHFSQECVNCADSFFLYDCRNCTDCFGCTNLRNARHCWFNEQLSPEGYAGRLKENLPLTQARIADLERTASHVRARAVTPEFFVEKVEEVSGNHLYESKNLIYCFDAKQCEDSRYCFTAFGLQQCYDLSFTGSASRYCLDSLTLAQCERVLYSHLVHHSYDIAYSEFCFHSHDLFGCIGLRHGEYCILNRPYSRDDYVALRAKIISDMTAQGSWGEFFPMAHSPFAYNESIASEYMPLSKNEALARGLAWADDVPSSMSTREKQEQVSVREANVIVCEDSGKPFRLTRAEIDLYERLSLPRPRICPDLRHEKRMARRFPRELFERRCQTCAKNMRTSVPLTSSQRVVCETCYQKALYQAA